MALEVLSRKIRTMRIERKMTQKDLGDALTVSDKTISKWETGRGMPDVIMLRRLSNVFGCSVDDLVNE